MRRFSAKRENHDYLMFLPLLILVLVILAFVIVSNTISTSEENREYALLDKAVTRSITQCYALEGMYPPSLDYLKEHYGLTYNEEHFYIDYQYIGANLRPDVTIIERN